MILLSTMKPEKLKIPKKKLNTGLLKIFGKELITLFFFFQILPQQLYIDLAVVLLILKKIIPQHSLRFSGYLNYRRYITLVPCE